MKKLLFLLTVSILFHPVLGQAAVLYLEPSEGEYYQNDTFIVNVRIDTEEDCINTVEANLSFSKDVLEVTGFSTSNSLISIWLKQPTADEDSGLIYLIGGIPGGFCGTLPGDPGESNLLAKMVFRVKEVEREQKAEIRFSSDSQVLLNDGFGTKAKLTLRGAILNILSGFAETPKDEWEMELLKDTIPQEPFDVEIVQDPLIFDGKYFIVFQTQDKQTGIDYYEAKEGKKDWQRAESPYLLEDQSLSSTIKVKAVDRAGNERIAEYLPEKKACYWWIIILILAGIVLVWWAARKSKSQNAK